MTRSSPMWTTVNDFHIEKIRLPVVMITTGGERIEGDLFAQPNARLARGHEEVPDLLNGSDAYFPLDLRNGRVLLCAKSRVRQLHFSTESVDAVAWAIATMAKVAITIEGGDVVAGTLLIELESARQRVLDFLNRYPSRFVPVHTTRDVVLINRDHIVYVEQVA